jgi:hypothetical protein
MSTYVGHQIPYHPYLTRLLNLLDRYTYCRLTLVVERHPLRFSRTLDVFKCNGAVVAEYPRENDAVRGEILSIMLAMNYLVVVN